LHAVLAKAGLHDGSQAGVVFYEKNSHGANL